MIRKIGVICEDRISYGFLNGLRERLQCNAVMLEARGIGISTHLTKRTAKRAWKYFQGQSVDLVVRLVDADQDKWRDVRKREFNLFPEEARVSDTVVCGVATRNVEDWLCLDKEFLANALNVNSHDLDNDAHRTGRIKRGIARIALDGMDVSDVVAGIVGKCKPDVFRRWIQSDESLRTFYSDCRSAAERATCKTPNELNPV